MNTINSTNENWLPIPGFEGAYMVSDLGRVKSLDRIITSTLGQRYEAKGRLLKPVPAKSGHLSVSLSKGSKIKRAFIHTLVMLAHVGEKPKGLDICHHNGDPTDNRLENLRYDTRANNIKDSMGHGTFSEAEIHPYAILSNSDALAIYNAIGVSAEALGVKYGISAMVVNQIWRGDTWKSVTGGKPVTKNRGRATYLCSVLSEEQIEHALWCRENRISRNDGRSPSAIARAFGRDADCVKSLYRAIDTGKAVYSSEGVCTNPATIKG